MSKENGEKDGTSLLPDTEVTASLALCDCSEWMPDHWNSNVTKECQKFDAVSNNVVNDRLVILSYNSYRWQSKSFPVKESF